MIPVLDRPLIEHVIRYLSSKELMDKIIVVTDLSSRGKQIFHYFDRKHDIYTEKLQFVGDRNEGTGGSILRSKKFLNKDSPFLVWFSDNLCPLNIEGMLSFHTERKCVATVAVSTRRKEETGFVEVDSRGRIRRFMEKPIVELRQPESLGIYVFDYKIIKIIERTKRNRRRVNLSLDVLQKMPERERIFAYDVGDSPWIDVESPARLERNMDRVEQIIRLMQAG